MGLGRWGRFQFVRLYTPLLFRRFGWCSRVGTGVGQEIASWSGMVLGKHTLLRMQGALGIVLGTSTMARNHGGIYYLQLPGMAVPLSRKKDGNQCLETNTW